MASWHVWQIGVPWSSSTWPLWFLAASWKCPTKRVKAKAARLLEARSGTHTTWLPPLSTRQVTKLALNQVMRKSSSQKEKLQRTVATFNLSQWIWLFTPLGVPPRQRPCLILPSLRGLSSTTHIQPSVLAFKGLDLQIDIYGPVF